MRKLFTTLLAVLLLLSGVNVQAAAKDHGVDALLSPEYQAEKFTEDVTDQKGKSGQKDYLVEFYTDIDLSAKARGIAAQGANGKKAQGKAVVAALKQEADRIQKPFRERLDRAGLEYESFFVVNMMRVKADHATILRLAEDPSVRQVYLDRTIQLAPVQPEEVPAAIPGTIQWNISRVGASQLWNLGIDGRGVVVGIIDSGVSWTHSALQTKFRAFDPAAPGVPSGSLLAASWFDAVNYRSTPYDDNGHGTHVTGTIVGQTPELALGVAPGASWIAAKVLNADGAAAMSWIIRAGEWMIAPGGDPAMAPDVINNSWGGDDIMDDWFRAMVRNWRAAGIVPVFAAGNQLQGEAAPWPGSISNPAHYPESFAVAAVDSNNALGSFSKLGPSPYAPELIKPDIAAPGVGISSAIPGGGYAAYSGTSMAAPHIAGAAALVLSANRSLTVDEVLYALMRSATPLTNGKYPASPNMAFGYGLVNAKAAYDLSKNGFNRASITASLRDEASGRPIMGAEIRLLQMTAMDPMVTDLEGAFSVADLPAGTYDLSLYHPKYGTLKKTVTLAKGANRLDLTMRDPGSQTGRLSYDDGSPENGLVFNTAGGNGFGVVFQPQRYGKIRSVSAYFYDESFPIGSTGTTMDLVLYEADEYMNPTRNALTEPIRVGVLRGGWKEFDLSSLQIMTDRPFVAVFHQPFAREESPAIGIDVLGTTGTRHSYLYYYDYGMDTLRETGFHGSFMIRAAMDYSMKAPKITGVKSFDPLQKTLVLSGKYFTNGEHILIEGTSPVGQLALRYHTDLGAVNEVETGTFSLPIYELMEGERGVQAVLWMGDRPVLASNEIRLVRDTWAPEIILDSPDRYTVDSRMLHITGRIEEANLAAFTINGRPVTMNPDNTFAFELKLNEGINPVTLAARDIMDNTTEKTIEVECLPAQGDVARLAGSNRYATAVEVSRNSYESATTAVLVTGQDYPDALASGPLAYALDGPILLTGTNSLNPRTASELTRLGVSQVIILGGPTVVSEAVVDTLTGMGITTTRIAGSNRYWTAAAAASHMLAEDPAIDHVTLASGESFADALAAGSAAARSGSPILLTRGTALSPAALEFITANGIMAVDLIGGPSVISTEVEDALLTMGISVRRFAGSNRFGTSVEIAREKFADATEAVFVSGMDFPDALSAAPYAARINAPVILVRKDAVSAAVMEYLPVSSLDFGTVVGGEAAVDNTVRAILNGLLEQ